MKPILQFTITLLVFIIVRLVSYLLIILYIVWLFNLPDKDYMKNIIFSFKEVNTIICK